VSPDAAQHEKNGSNEPNRAKKRGGEQCKNVEISEKISGQSVFAKIHRFFKGLLK
jgi:hypothetical protein